MWKKIPSPKWLAAGLIVTAGGSGIAYDKYEQSQIRSKYMEHVSEGSHAPLETNLRPRKLLVIVAPPPNDYLDTSLKLWRRWVKPILYSSGLDYEVVTGTKQGEIRTEIANRVRSLRARLIEQKSEELKQEEEKKNKKWWWFGWRSTSKRTVKDGGAEADESVVEQAPKFDTRSVLGIFYHNEPKQVVTEDSQVDPSIAGGVICIGRGAYKEYIDGVHEGVLGPLEAPVESPAEEPLQEPVAAETAPTTKEQNPDLSAVPVTKLLESEIPESVEGKSLKQDEQPAKSEVKEETTSETDINSKTESDTETPSEEKESQPLIVKPFIKPSEYENATIPPELSSQHIIDPATGAPAFFQQPLLVLAVPNLSGFTTIPTRISRFYQKRFNCEQVSHSTLAMVESKSRPFTETDLDLAAYEELDWPKNWVEEGKKRGSEWVQPLKGDPRIMEKLRVIEPAMVSPLSPQSESETDSS